MATNSQPKSTREELPGGWKRFEPGYKGRAPFSRSGGYKGPTTVVLSIYLATAENPTDVGDRAIDLLREAGYEVGIVSAGPVGTGVFEG